MLGTLEEIVELGLVDVLLPWSSYPILELILCVEDETLWYQGPVLKQRRADYFFEAAGELDRFDWNEIIVAQQRLWGSGFALKDAAGLLGPNGWALHQGSLRLADTGSLTTNEQQARWVHQERVLDRVTERWLTRTRGTQEHELLKDYLGFIRRHLGVAELAAHWRASIAANEGEAPP
jgi:hypothetical protein